MLAMHGAIELAVNGSDLFVNGAPLASKDTSVASMAMRIEQHKLGGILVLPAIDHAEFSIFIRLMSSPPAALANLGGLRQAIEGAGLRYLKLVNTEYRKVPEGQPPPPPPPPPPPTDVPEPPMVILFGAAAAAVFARRKLGARARAA